MPELKRSTLPRAHPALRLAAAAVLVATLGLAACGRKGDLDPPPASLAPAQTQSEQRGLPGPVGVMPLGGGSQPSSSAPGGVTRQGEAIAPPGENKRIPLDNLLN